jgi:hypothetical protein
MRICVFRSAATTYQIDTYIFLLFFLAHAVVDMYVSILNNLDQTRQNYNFFPIGTQQ